MPVLIVNKGKPFSEGFAYPLTDTERVERMKAANWKPAVTYWRERAEKAEAEREALRQSVLFLIFLELFRK